MITLILLSIGLISLVGALCAATHARVVDIEGQKKIDPEQLSRIEETLREMLVQQQNMQERIDQISADVLQRDIYAGPGDRHQMAIAAAREGGGVNELMTKHGLSADEASLVVSLNTYSGKNLRTELTASEVVD